MDSFVVPSLKSLHKCNNALLGETLCCPSGPQFMLTSWHLFQWEGGNKRVLQDIQHDVIGMIGHILQYCRHTIGNADMKFVLSLFHISIP